MAHSKPSSLECVCLQLGGTVGDIESMPFIEAFRQFQFKVKRENFCNIHVSLIPQVSTFRPLRTAALPNSTYQDGRWAIYSLFMRLHCCVQPSATGEQKTKPTQNSVRELRGLGLSPDLVSPHEHMSSSVLVLRKILRK